jgi:hypothetical protein
MSIEAGSFRRAGRMAAMAVGVAMALATAALVAPAMADEAPAAAAAPLPLELNKLEPLTAPAAGCRVYFLVSNPDSEPFTTFVLDVILFAKDGVIARRIGFDLAPLASKKTAVKLFDLNGLACDDIGKVLINDVISCSHKGETSTDADKAACLDRLALTSRAKAAVTK